MDKKPSTEESLDHSLCVELCKHIEQLTHSGKSSLDPGIMKKVKGVCKKSDGYVKYAHDQVMDQLEQNHSEIRLSAFQITDELFNRSHAFRDLLLSHFQEFMELTIESNADMPLPPPKPAAKTLKRTAMEAIQKWHLKYGEEYKKLALGYNFLKNCKKVEFTGAQVRTQAEQRRNDEQNRRTEMMRKQRLDTVLNEISEFGVDFKDVLLQVENCLKLLLPDPESFQIHGLMSPEYQSPQENPFKSYPQRTPVYPTESSCRKTSDPSRIKNRRVSSNTSSLAASGDQHKAQNHETDPARGDIPLPISTVVKSEPKDKTKVSQKSSPATRDLSSDNGLIRDIKVEKGISPTHASSDTTISSTKSKKKETSSKDVKVKIEETNVSDKIQRNTDNGSEEDFQEISSNDGSESEEEEEEEEEELCEEDVVRSFGLVTQKYRMSIEINPEDLAIEENEDNTDVLRTMRDSYRQIMKKFIPKVQRWLEVLSKTGASEADVRKVIDMKTALETASKRVVKLKIKHMSNVKKSEVKDEEDDDDDDDFLDVPDKEGYEEDIPEHLREELGMMPKTAPASTPRDWQPAVPNLSFKKQPAELDPTSSEATLFKILEKTRTQRSGADMSASRKRPSSSKGSPAIKEKVPVVPFGTDLMHWGEEKPEKPLVVRYESSHRFWNTGFDEDAEIVDKVAVEAMNKRTINFTGKFEPVKWTCRAPLPNGKLCPRQDRVKCPFHGKIVGRDNMGQPSNPEDRARIIEEEEQKKRDQPAEWEDPQLQAEIEAATGVSLNPGTYTKGKRKSKKKHPGLTNIKKVACNPKSRLEKKVLNARARNRVEQKMTGISNKRITDKFGNNFNYALN